MSLDRELARDLPTLLALFLDGQMTVEDETQLADLLRDNPEAQQVYLDYCWTHALLRRELGGRDNNEEAIWNPQQGVCASAPGEASLAIPLANAQSFPAPVAPSPFFIDTSSPAPPPSFVGGLLFSYMVATVIMGIGLSVAAFVYVSHPTQVSRETTFAASPATARPSPLAPRPSSFVGQVTGMVDCRWAGKGLGIRDWGLGKGRKGPNQKYLVSIGDAITLSSGLMEITYDTGAKIILQGPCTYEVESKTGGYLSLGKLTARVEKGLTPKAQGPRTEEVVSGLWSVVSGRKSEIQNPKSKTSSPQSLAPSPSSVPSPLSPLPSHLFAVRTPTAIVTDLGTEFGVEVHESGVTSASVFQGVVEVQPIASDGHRGHAVQLTENESACVEKGESSEGLTVRRAESDPVTFVRVGQLSKLAEERRLKSFRRWQAYSEELRRDPSLLAYYDFQLKPGSPAVLPNVAGNGHHAIDGAVENATWSTGRMTGKHALLFNGPADYVRVNLPQKTDDLTLAAWVCFDTLKGIGPAAVLLGSENWLKPGQIHWMVDAGDGRMVFGSATGGNAVGPAVVDNRQFRRWIHLACVYDHAAERMWFYVGGRRVSEVDFRTGDPICIGPAWIGNWNQERRNFRGRMDELAIFGRPLAAEEVQRIYEEGRP